MAIIFASGDSVAIVIASGESVATVCVFFIERSGRVKTDGLVLGDFLFSTSLKVLLHVLLSDYSTIILDGSVKLVTLIFV